jgi:hypothetical protein
MVSEDQRELMIFRSETNKSISAICVVASGAAVFFNIFRGCPGLRYKFSRIFLNTALFSNNNFNYFDRSIYFYHYTSCFRIIDTVNHTSSNESEKYIRKCN